MARRSLSEDGSHVEEETQAGRDHRQAAPSGRADRSRHAGGRCGALGRRDRGGLRDELLNGEIFYSLREAQIIIESWRRHYNGVRPHASVGFRPPAPELVLPTFAVWPAAPRRPASPPTPAAAAT